MVLKTFNLDEVVYSKFSAFCKDNGISMSKQIQFFMEAQLTDDPKAKAKYLEKIEKIKSGKFIRVNNFANRYRL